MITFSLVVFKGSLLAEAQIGITAIPTCEASNSVHVVLRHII